jgi:hypothetical protein
MGSGPSEYRRARFPIQTKMPDVLESEELQEASRRASESRGLVFLTSATEVQISQAQPDGE